MIPASRLRLILAIYLDWVVYSVPWGLAHAAVSQAWPQWREVATPIQFLLFTVLEVVLHGVVRWSPGRSLLGMRAVPHVQGFQVEAGLKARESWVTILTGVLLLLDGSKSMVRWSMWVPPMPYFGAFVGDDVWPAIAMTSGLVECGIAFLYFRMHRASGIAAIAYFAWALVVTFTSWTLWDPWVAELTQRRRAFQGLEVRPHEIETLQDMTPELMVVGIAVYLALAIAAWVVILRRTTNPAAPHG